MTMPPMATSGRVRAAAAAGLRLGGLQVDAPVGELRGAVALVVEPGVVQRLAPRGEGLRRPALLRVLQQVLR
jgi:hypothetical protein